MAAENSKEKNSDFLKTKIKLNVESEVEEDPFGMKNFTLSSDPKR